MSNVTAEGLQNVLAEVLKDRDERLHQALGRLEQSDAEAAELLRGLVDEVASLRHSRYGDGGVSEELARRPSICTGCFSRG